MAADYESRIETLIEEKEALISGQTVTEPETPEESDHSNKLDDFLGEWTLKNWILGDYEVPVSDWGLAGTMTIDADNIDLAFGETPFDDLVFEYENDVITFTLDGTKITLEYLESGKLLAIMDPGKYGELKFDFVRPVTE